MIANESGARFSQLSAVTSGTADVRAAIQGAREARTLDGARTILFIDEIHRFNKAQQDLLLPAIEDAVVTLIGATTENPFFEVNSALLSRCQLYRFEPLPADLVERLVAAALADGSAAWGKRPLRRGRARLPGRRVGWRRAGGAQRARAAWRSRPRRPGAPVTLTLDDLHDAAQKSPVVYDREDAHYDTVSAFIKSMRGSDPDAAVYYLASMIDGGEDPRFIARRMIVFASEDVGNADPRALQVAVDAARAVDFVGLPEAASTSSQAVTYLSLAPKSNAAYKAIDAALEDVRAARAISRRPRTCATPTTAARRNSDTARGTSTRTPSAAGSSSSTCRTSSRAPLLPADTGCREPVGHPLGSKRRAAEPEQERADDRSRARATARRAMT